MKIINRSPYGTGPADFTSKRRRLCSWIIRSVWMTGVRDYSTGGGAKHNVAVALAKAAKALKLPGRRCHDGARQHVGSGRSPNSCEALPGIEIIDRSSVNAFDDVRVACAIEATGRIEADFRRHLARSLRGFSGHDSRGKGARRLCGAVDAFRHI